jgi:LITAF-like zinc ribbon domain
MGKTLGADAVYCTRCGFSGKHQIEWEMTSGNWIALVVLLLFFLLPGIIYAISLWVGGGSQGVRVCPKCNARRMWVPLGSPLHAANQNKSG